MANSVLLTGGAGFIGSHTYAALVAAGYDVTIFDNFENARLDLPERLQAITGTPTRVYEGDIRQPDDIEAALAATDYDAVVHFAAKKSVAEGEENPLSYYGANCTGLQNVVEAMNRHRVRRLVFSSSAAVYGNPESVPIKEDSRTAPESVYGWTKLYGEILLEALIRTDPHLRVGILRYFNPVGAHPSGLIGEDPRQRPMNLVPLIAEVALGMREKLIVFGGDYPTPDGTGLRDYIHVEDLARGHVLSLNALAETDESHTVNLGTGRGYSVMEVIRAYEAASGRKITYEITKRREGDPTQSFADTTRAAEILRFEAEHDLASMCASSWAFVQGAIESRD